MPSPKARSSRATKAIERFEGDTGHVNASGDTHREKKLSKSAAISASKVNTQKVTPKGGIVNGASTVKKTSTYTTKAVKIVERSGSSSPLFDAQEDQDQSFSENGHTASPAILPKVLVRLTVVKNGVYLPHPKSITMDPNLDFESFTTLFASILSDVFYYIAWQSKKEANVKKSRSSITNYASLQTEEDWEAIVHDIQSTYSNPKKPLNDMLLCVVGKVKINNSVHEIITDSDNEGTKRKTATVSQQEKLLASLDSDPYQKPFAALQIQWPFCSEHHGHCYISRGGSYDGLHYDFQPTEWGRWATHILNKTGVVYNPPRTEEFDKSMSIIEGRKRGKGRGNNSNAVNKDVISLLNSLDIFGNQPSQMPIVVPISIPSTTTSARRLSDP